MENEKLLQKVRNLLNITTEAGATEAEALAAFEAAQKIISRHHLDVADLSKCSSTITHIVIHPTGKSRIMWKEKILLALININNCYCVVRPYKPTNHTIFGPLDNLKIIQELYDLICSQVEYFSKQYPGKGKSEFNEFKLGCAIKISQRLRQADSQSRKDFMLEKGQTENTCTALVFLNTQMEQNKIKAHELFPKLGVLKQRIPVIKSSAFDDGLKQGDSVLLNSNKMIK